MSNMMASSSGNNSTGSGMMSSMLSSMTTDTDDSDSDFDVDLEVADDYAPLNDTSLPSVYVNGQLQPSVDMIVDEYKRLRFVNAVPNNVAELVTTAGSGCDLHVIAMDGIYFDTPKAKDVVVVPPGGRADVIVMCSEAGTFYLETDCATSRNKILGKVNQYRVPSQQIVTLQVSAESGSAVTGLPSTLPARPSYLVDSVGAGSGSAEVDVSSIPDSNKYDYAFNMGMSGSNMGMAYGVNGKTFDASYVNHSMPVDELQQWELSVSMPAMMMSCDVGGDSESDSGDDGERRLMMSMSSMCHTMVHPFHIHATHFQVSGMDADADPDGVMFEVGEWRDTLPLFRSGVQIRFTPRDYMVGNDVFTHCHIAHHADVGMAQFVGVYNTTSTSAAEEGDADLTASEVSGTVEAASYAEER